MVTPAVGATLRESPGSSSGTDGSECQATDEALAREEQAILDHARRTRSVSNTECRQLLGVQMHQAWYLLNKLHRRGRLRQEGDRRWARYRPV